MADAQYGELKGLGSDDYESLFIIVEDGSYGTPSAAYCDQIKAQYGLTMPVLIDDGTIVATLGLTSKNHWNIVVGEGAEIVFKSKYKDAESKVAIEELLD